MKSFFTSVGLMVLKSLILRIKKLVNKRLGDKELLKPQDICFRNDQFFFTDQTNVSIFDNNLKLLSSFPVPPQKFGNVPYLTVDDNFIYVTSNSTHNVYIYTKERKVKNTIGSSSRGSADGTFNDPSGLTTNKNTLYVCDLENHRTQAFSTSKFIFENKWGSKGTGNGQFHFPGSISYSVDVLYVGDMFSIQLFTTEGTFIQRIGSRYVGMEEGKFSVIAGICIRQNELYVSDRGNKRIQVFRRKE